MWEKGKGIGRSKETTRLHLIWRLLEREGKRRKRKVKRNTAWNRRKEKRRRKKSKKETLAA